MSFTGKWNCVAQTNAKEILEAHAKSKAIDIKNLEKYLAEPYLTCEFHLTLSNNNQNFHFKDFFPKITEGPQTIRDHQITFGVEVPGEEWDSATAKLEKGSKVVWDISENAKEISCKMFRASGELGMNVVFTVDGDKMVENIDMFGVKGTRTFERM